MLIYNFSDFLKQRMIRFCIDLYEVISCVLVEFCVDEAFEIQGNRDIKGIKETQKIKLGDAQGTPR